MAGIGLATLGRSRRVKKFVYLLRGVWRGRRAASQDRGQGRDDHLRDSGCRPRSRGRASRRLCLRWGVQLGIHSRWLLGFGGLGGNGAGRMSSAWKLALELARSAQVAGGPPGGGH